MLVEDYICSKMFQQTGRIMRINDILSSERACLFFYRFYAELVGDVFFKPASTSVCEAEDCRFCSRKCFNHHLRKMCLLYRAAILSSLVINFGYRTDDSFQLEFKNKVSALIIKSSTCSKPTSQTI